MDMVRAIYHAVAKDAFLELRRGYALGGLIVFVLCTVFIIYLSLVEIEPEIWVALYWIAFLFLSVHAILKSFASESSRRFMYYYTLMAPEVLFVAKCIYNTFVLAGLGLIMFGALSLVTTSPVVNTWLFAATIGMGALGISLAFTFISAIAIKSDNSATLMTILSFPVIIPVFLSLIKLSKASLEAAGTIPVTNSFLILGSIDLMLLALGLMMFPYLWKS